MFVPYISLLHLEVVLDPVISLARCPFRTPPANQQPTSRSDSPPCASKDKIKGRVNRQDNRNDEKFEEEEEKAQYKTSNKRIHFSPSHHTLHTLLPYPHAHRRMISSRRETKYKRRENRSRRGGERGGGLWEDRKTNAMPPIIPARIPV
jgi:hypothetical protein